jgi:hypothetical protein
LNVLSSLPDIPAKPQNYHHLTENRQINMHYVIERKQVNNKSTQRGAIYAQKVVSENVSKI